MIEYRVAVDEYRTVWRNAEGQLHREDGPAIEDADGDMEWYLNGQLHREDGPAIMYPDTGYEAWYRNDKTHREDGPAIMDRHGYKAWHRNGKFHREDGPAIEWPDGARAWYLNGEHFTEEVFLAHTAKGPEEIVVDGIMYRRAD